MKFGIALDYFDPEISPSRTFEICREIVIACRDAGFDLVYKGHHFLEDKYVNFQATPLTARLAADAGDMLILCADLLPLNNPVRVAENLATLDVMTDGRAMLLGVTGYQSSEFAAFGVSKSQRGRRVSESYEIVSRLLHGETVVCHTDHYALEGVRLGGLLAPVAKPRPPIWVTGHAGKGLIRAATHGDAWFISHQPTLSEIRQQLGDYNEAREAREPQDFHRHENHGITLPLLREAFVAPTTERAIELARDPMMAVVEGYKTTDQLAELNDADSYDRPFDEWRTDRAVIGDPEEVTRDLMRYRDELGVDCSILKIHRAGIPFEHVLEAIELVGREVIPAFRAEPAQRAVATA
jgi:alkanesulfonate monooxygenase SsuD/methylene tetrahydromethanopterin reductase-like flavin-dependent oxidoreductase (luciferase family)